MTPRRVLIVNDDGPGAAGLAALVRAASSDSRHNIVVATPAVDSSSTGTALGTIWDTSIEAVTSARTWPSRVSAAFEVYAYPATIVTAAAMGAFGPPPELVLVGINHGPNVGRGLIHSSTVGAALTAAAHGIPAVALSAEGARGAGMDWAPWGLAVSRLLDALPDRWPPDGALNVNLPAWPADDPVSFAWCEVAVADADANLSTTHSGLDRISLAITYDAPVRAPHINTDAGALAAGRVALTWLTLPYGAGPDARWAADLIAQLAPPAGTLAAAVAR